MIHGTHPAYRAHLADGEPVCSRCQRFMARYEQERQLDILYGRDRLVDKAPTIRRIRALQAIGWDLRSLAAEMGRNESYFRVLCGRPGQPKVKASIAKEVDSLYDRLSMTIGPSAAGRSRAVKRGWPPPLAWEDIETGEIAVTDRQLRRREEASS